MDLKPNEGVKTQLLCFSTWDANVFSMEHKQEIQEMIAEIKAAIIKYDRSPVATFEAYTRLEEFRKICNPYAAARLIRYIEQSWEDKDT